MWKYVPKTFVNKIFLNELLCFSLKASSNFSVQPLIRYRIRDNGTLIRVAPR